MAGRGGGETGRAREEKEQEREEKRGAGPIGPGGPEKKKRRAGLREQGRGEEGGIGARDCMFC